MYKQKSRSWMGPLMFASLCLLVFACSKDLVSTINKEKVNLEDPGLAMNAELAKMFYNKLKTEKDNKVNMALYQGTGGGGKVMPLKSEAGNNIINRKHILFKKAYSSETELSTFTEIPVVYNQRFSSVVFPKDAEQKNTALIKKEIFAASFDRLIIYKNKISGKINYRVVSFIPNIEYLRKNNNDISHNHITKLDNDFDGYLEYKEWDGTPLYLLEIKNGKRIKALSLKQGAKGQTANFSKAAPKKLSALPSSGGGGVMTPNVIVCEYTVVEVWGESCVTADPEGGYQTCEPYFISASVEESCYDDGYDPCNLGGCGTGDPCIDYGDCGNDGGGGGSTSDPNEEENQNNAFLNGIDTSKLQPCMKNIFESIKDLNSSIPILIREFSIGAPGFNWEMKDGILDPDVNATTLYNRTNATATTTFDTQKFADASDLAIVRTMMHESIHAYLTAYFANDPINANKTYPEMVTQWTISNKGGLNSAHHDEFVRGFIDKIANSLTEYGDQQGYVFTSGYEKAQFYNDLAWGGLTSTQAFNALSSTDKNRIKDRLNSEQYDKDRNGNPLPSKGADGGC